jgi:hypothetical protein
MKTFLSIFAFCFIFILAGCSQELKEASPVSVETETLSKVPVPLKGYAEGLGYSTLPTAPPWHTYAELIGSGNATHLGKFTFTSTHKNEVILNSNGQLAIFDGIYKNVAANGDELHGTYTGAFTPFGGNIFKIEADIIVTGGTGRFLNATGEISLFGEMDANHMPRPSWYYVDGYILK